ncbi:hypothetical protein GGS21DRAFT_511237 [Xylaria nigripes]|nr:hypothetical protein GGS21DRAFT_511237 [Xylaria nigripes]
MSTNTGVNRTRSVRNPTSRDPVSAQVKAQNETRNTSPSRVAARPSTRPAKSSTTASTSTTGPRTRVATVTSRPSVPSIKKASSRTAEPAASASSKPLARVSSVRQAASTATASSATTHRSVSAPRPKSSGGSQPSSPKARPTGHARAKSTVTSLNTATTLRPTSRVTDPARSDPSPAPSTTSSASTNTQPKHTRTSSQSNPPTTTVPLAARRPAFNTNQQHYSPAKSQAPKPLTSTFLAPPSPSKQPANVALTAETSRLQTELLQLSLLHREAHATSKAWHQSARSKLQARFEEVAAADQDLQTVEREAAEERGLQDLLRWGNAGAEKWENKGTDTTDEKKDILPLDERIQLLDQVLNGVWTLGEPNSRYQRVVNAFEDWAHQVAEIRAAQQAGDVDALLTCGDKAKSKPHDSEEKGFGIFVSDLDAGGWKRDHAGLVRMLKGWRKTLSQLETVDNDDDEDRENDDGDNVKPLSGLARALRGCRSLVHDMLSELDVMEQIERDALAAEDEWMEGVEAQLLSVSEDDETRRAEDVPPWKTLVF